MSIFSGKKVRTNGFQFMPLGTQDGLTGYWNARKKMLFVSGGDSQAFMDGFKYYRRGLGSRYKSSKTSNIGFNPFECDVVKSSSNSLLLSLNCQNYLNRFHVFNKYVLANMYGWDLTQKPSRMILPTCPHDGVNYHPAIGACALGLEEEANKVSRDGVDYKGDYRENALRYVVESEFNLTDGEDAAVSSLYKYYSFSFFIIGDMASSTNTNYYKILSIKGTVGDTPSIPVIANMSYTVPQISFTLQGYELPVINQTIEFSSPTFTIDSKTIVRIESRLIEEQVVDANGDLVFTEEQAVDADDNPLTDEDGNPIMVQVPVMVEKIKWFKIPTYVNYTLDLIKKTRVIGVSLDGSYITSWNTPDIGVDFSYTNIGLGPTGTPLTLSEGEDKVSVKKFYAAPLCNIKTIDDGVLIKRKSDIPIGFNDDQRRRDKFMKLLSVDFESVQEFIEKSSTVNATIGMTIAPQHSLKSRAVAKVMYEFLDTLGGETGINEASAIENSLELTIDIEDKMHGVYKFKYKKFNNPPSDDVRKWKIKCKLDRKLSELKYAEVKHAYERCFPTSPVGSQTTKELYNAVVQLGRTATATDDQKDAYYNLPPRDTIRNRQPHKYLVVDCIESDIAAESKDLRSYNVDDLDPTDDGTEMIEVWDIVSYKEIKTHSSYRDYYGRTYGDSNLVVWDDEADALTLSGSFYIPWFPKQITTSSPNKIYICNSEKRIGFSFYGASMSWIVDDTGWRANNIQFELETQSFRLPMQYDALDKGVLYYKAELYSFTPSLSLFSTKVSKMKWYQRGIWMTIITIIIIIVAVVITVATAGAGATPATIAAELAISLLTSYAIQAVFNYIAEEFGIDLGLIGDIVRFALAAYQGDYGTATQIAGLRLSDEYVRHELDLQKSKAKSLAREVKDFYKKVENDNRKLDFGLIPPKDKADYISHIENRDAYLTSAIMPRLNVAITEMMESSEFNYPSEESRFIQPQFDLRSLLELNHNTVKNAFPTNNPSEWLSVNTAGDNTK